MESVISTILIIYFQELLCTGLHSSHWFNYFNHAHMFVIPAGLERV
jgi:hypothetical protein